ncbi:rRNA biogenesis protein rrp36, partial [Pyricularia oryzae]
PKLKPERSTDQNPFNNLEPSWKGRKARDSSNSSGKPGSKSTASAAVPGRKTRSAPEEMSSERPVSRYREVAKSPPRDRPKPRDVRLSRS